MFGELKVRLSSIEKRIIVRRIVRSMFGELTVHPVKNGLLRDKVTGQCPQTTTFEKKGEPKRIRTEVPLLTSLAPYR